jgi:hypothetical protein
VKIKYSPVSAGQAIDRELIPLRNSLWALAEKFGLMHNGQPAIWAMDTMVETLHQRARRPKRRKVSQWFHMTCLSQEYPAQIEPDWIPVTGQREEELYAIVVKVAPKRPEESFKAFERRFNKACREVREEYIREVKAKKWVTRPPYRDFTWIDRFAQWQLGHKVSEILPSAKTPSRRSAFSRGIKAVGEYIGITPRMSKHNPRRRSGH